MRTELAPGPWLRLSALVAAGGTLLAVISGAEGLGTAHKLLAALVAPPLAALLVSAWYAHRRLVPSVLAAAALFAAAAAVPGPHAHAGLAAFALAALVIVFAESFRGERVPQVAEGDEVRPDARGFATGVSSLERSWRDYVALTKPRIMSLLLITGFCGMIAGARGWPGTGLAAAAMAGLALACGGASALNHVLDRDIDPLMGKRTSARPVASGRVPPSRAFEFGLALMALSFVLLASAVNVLTAVLALVGGLFYVIVYTRWLKRSTSQNIVIGGAAGAVPPLVGWAAATGNVGLAALLLFAIVFIWTPPHFWALAILIKDNYANARVPMLPVVRGDRATARQIVLYSVVLVAATLLPWAWGGAGPLYVVCALALGAVFLWLADRLRRDTTPRRAMLLFHYSLLYLALLFAALAVDAVIG
jgi:protoheme IX farnesyltransferase